MKNGNYEREEAAFDSPTKLRSSLDAEYQIYLFCADAGNGLDVTTGEPLKSFDEWLGEVV
mgnify:CR=1 FL=1